MGAMPRRSHAVVLRPEQLGALVSPVRQEILDVMATLGAVSLAELGAKLGRPSDGLYYHVRRLVRLGLVRSAGMRRNGKRDEELFRAVAPRFRIRHPSAPAQRARAVLPVVAAMLRLGIRDARRALADARTRVEGSDPEVLALRTTGWLSQSQLHRVHRQIFDLSRSTAQRGPGDRLYAVTILLTPLVQRDNTTGRRPRKDA
jgi:hypothetical protein